MSELTIDCYRSLLPLKNKLRGTMANREGQKISLNYLYAEKNRMITVKQISNVLLYNSPYIAFCYIDNSTALFKVQHTFLKYTNCFTIPFCKYSLL